MIEINGRFTLVADFLIEVPMTIEEFDSLSTEQQEELVNYKTDLYEVTKQADVHEIEIWDVIDSN